MKKRKTKLITRNETPSWYIAKNIIRSKGVSLKDLAEKMNVSISSVHAMVNYAPSIVRVKMIADIVGCSFFDFFDFSSERDGKTSMYHHITPENGEGVFVCPSCGQRFAVIPIEDVEEPILEEEESFQE